MATGGVLRGHVIDDETGTPVPPGVSVWAGFEGRGDRGRSCETGEGGTYELMGIETGDLTLTVYDAPLHQRFKGNLTLGRAK